MSFAPASSTRVAAREDVASPPARVFDTAPPPPSHPDPALRRLKRQVVSGISGAIRPLLQAAARDYVGGQTVDDALCAARRVCADGHAVTLGYWNAADDTVRQATDGYLEAIHKLSAAEVDSYVSIKPPTLRFDATLVHELSAAAAVHKVRLHCDSHGTDVADLSCAMVQTLTEGLDASLLGTTLPGRWKRSLGDADWAVARQVNVRVVKGQWPDPDDPRRDMSIGFLDVIDRLAGRARHVAVATHDLPLARDAIARLKSAGTPFELELLFGVATPQLIDWARDNKVKTRIYVPFGPGFIPNAIGVLKRNPRLILSIVRQSLNKQPSIAAHSG